MSGRPRPVTATVTRQPEPDFIPMTPRTADLSSGSETASLCSVLDHDSYMSPDDSEPEEEKQTDKKPNKKREKERENSKSASINDTSYTLSFSTEEPTPSSSSPKKSTESNENHENKKNEKNQTNGCIAEYDQQSELCWEEWMVRKAKEMRITQRQEAKRRLQIKREEELKTLEKKKKEIKVLENVRNWQEMKIIEEELRKSTQKQSKLTQKQVAEQQKKQIEEKAAVKYQEWLDEKQEQEKRQKQQEREKKKEEESKKTAHRDKCERAFAEWKKKASKRPKSAPNSFGFIEGELKGYYDTSSLPIPAFFNPVPWQPIHVPQPKSQKPKPKNKTKRWNPAKYL